MNILERYRFELRRRTASAILDLEDRYARDLGLRGRHPRPIGALRFYLVEQLPDGAPARAFDPPLEMVVRRNPSGYYVFFGSVKWSDGTVRKQALTAGKLAVRIESRFYQTVERTEVELHDPPRPHTLALEPNHTYPFPDSDPVSVAPLRPADCISPGLVTPRGPTVLRGGLHHVDGRGMAEAKITVRVGSEEHAYQTDRSGQWLLAFPASHPTGRVTVRFELPGRAVTRVADVCLIQGRATTLAQTALRGWVLSGDGVGIAGATVRVSGFAEPSTTREDGSWFYYFALNQPPAAVAAVDVTVELPDGRSQARTVHPIVSRATVVVPTFRFP